MELRMTPLRLSPDDTTVVVVDLQERLMPSISGGNQIVAATRLVLQAAATLGVPVLTTTQYAKGLGPIVPAVFELVRSTPLDKTSFSCFGSPEFAAALAALGRKTVLLCGVEAHICVLQTGLDAIANGFAVHVITDATGSRSDRDAELGWRRLERTGAVLSSAEMAIYELLRVSGTPAFGSLLPHLK